MHLRLALMSLLVAQPMTGFDIKRQFDDSVGYFWHAPHTQIYPELRKLEAEGLIEGEEVARGARGRKTRYHITESGREQLRAWLNTVEEPRRDRDPFKLRAANFELAAPESAYAQLRAHERHYSREATLYEGVRENLLARRVPLLQARLQITPPEEHEAIIAFRAYAYSGLIRRARGEVEWAREGLQLLERLNPGLTESQEASAAAVGADEHVG
ncbi:PadR family transcriptional regulator [Streptomyces sioyaensis]|uniref:PadR family transcriptional regulator n=1 Tax=Streptomyces sioyaensis TaxID=67364 RepID=UPI003D749310